MPHERRSIYGVIVCQKPSGAEGSPPTPWWYSECWQQLTGKRLLTENFPSSLPSWTVVVIMIYRCISKAQRWRGVESSSPSSSSVALFRMDVSNLHLCDIMGIHPPPHLATVTTCRTRFMLFRHLQSCPSSDFFSAYQTLRP